MRKMHPMNMFRGIEIVIQHKNTCQWACIFMLGVVCEVGKPLNIKKCTQGAFFVFEEMETMGKKNATIVSHFLFSGAYLGGEALATKNTTRWSHFSFLGLGWGLEVIGHEKCTSWQCIFCVGGDGLGMGPSNMKNMP